MHPVTSACRQMTFQRLIFRIQGASEYGNPSKSLDQIFSWSWYIWKIKKRTPVIGVLGADIAEHIHFHPRPGLIILFYTAFVIELMCYVGCP